MRVVKESRRALERGVEWRPQHDPHFVVARILVSARQAPPLHVLQQVLLELDALPTDPRGAVHFGLLLGRLCYSPGDAKQYVLVDGTAACSSAPPGPNLSVAMADALTERIATEQRGNRLVVGFYRTGAAVVPRPAASDVALLRALFPDPWQAMLVVGSDQSGPVGAIVRVETLEQRAYAVSFVELLPRRRRAPEPPRTAVRWTNYHAAEEVQPLPATVGSIAPARPTGAPLFGSLGARLVQRVGAALRPAPTPPTPPAEAARQSPPPLPSPPLPSTPRRAAPQPSAALPPPAPPAPIPSIASAPSVAASAPSVAASAPSVAASAPSVAAPATRDAMVSPPPAPPVDPPPVPLQASTTSAPTLDDAPASGERLVLFLPDEPVVERAAQTPRLVAGAVVLVLLALAAALI